MRDSEEISQELYEKLRGIFNLGKNGFDPEQCSGCTMLLEDFVSNMTEPNASNLYARIAGFLMGVGEDIAKTFTVDAETIITGKWQYQRERLLCNSVRSTSWDKRLTPS